MCERCYAASLKRVRALDAATKYAKRHSDYDDLTIFRTRHQRPVKSAPAMLDTAPLVAYLHEAFPNRDAAHIATLLGIEKPDRVRNLLDGKTPKLRAQFIDRMLTGGLGRPDLFDVLYEGVAA